MAALILCGATSLAGAEQRGAPVGSAFEPHRLRPGQSVKQAAIHHYGDKYYLWVLEKHMGRLPRRRATEIIPSLEQMLALEGVLRRASSAFALVLRAQGRLRALTRADQPGCHRAWRPGEQARARRAAKEVKQAIALLSELSSAPRRAIKQLEGAARALESLGARGREQHGGCCKSYLGAHKRFSRALVAAIDWSRQAPW